MSRSVRLTAVSLAALGSVLVCGCSSKSTKQPSAGTSSTGSTAAAGGSTAPAAGGSTAAAAGGSTAPAAGGGTASAPAAAGGLAAKVCTAIKIADVQPLVKATITKVDFDPGSAEVDPTHSFQCSVDNPTMTIRVHPEDAAKEVYTLDVTSENVPSVALSGVGDVAVWAAVSLSPGSYTSAPDVFAHKGSVTCEVLASGTGLTIPTEPGVAAPITQANEATFAAKFGVLCNDVFAAIG